MNLHVQKNAVVVLTESEFDRFNNVLVEKGAVLVTVPDSSTTEERVQAAKDLA